MGKFNVVAVLIFSSLAWGGAEKGDLLIKFKPGRLQSTQLFGTLSSNGNNAEVISDDLLHVRVAPALLESFSDREIINQLSTNADVEYVQPNFRLKLINDYKVTNEALREKIMALKNQRDEFSLFAGPKPDPALPKSGVNEVEGADPNLKQQWGMDNSGATQAWQKYRGNRDIVVGVIDTGIDYNHEDLVGNLWINQGEIPGNNIDDDNNGYVDDIVGWDFAQNDNKPFDITVDPLELLLGGGNPGHGTHCAGNVGGTGFNSKGISGVAPRVKIMGLRFLTEKGQGTTADALKAIAYGIKNGAKILSNSWGSEGEDPAEDKENKALRDAIQASQDAGVLFIAAAGNGHSGVGYDNDTDSKPGYPASYDNDIIISVAALNRTNELGDFSNWGQKSVDIGAPGVDIYSTVPGSKYNNVVFDGFGMKITWDGTSMATPQVSGAAALLWSQHPELTWQDVKARILQTATPTQSLKGKSVSEGRLNVAGLID